MKRIIALTLAFSFISVPAIAATKGQRHCKTYSFGQRWLYNICMTPNVGTGDFIDHGVLFWRH